MEQILLSDDPNSKTNKKNDNEETETAIIRCGTTKGDITLQLIREWSPIGYDRAVVLFEKQFYNGCHFFRVLPKFLVQFGISYTTNHELQTFAKQTINDDPVIPIIHPSDSNQKKNEKNQNQKKIPFEPGIISYAGNGINSRTSHLFISYGSTASLGHEVWETPIGKVISSMDVAESFYSGYGDEPPGGKGPRQGKIYNGPKYIEDNFPLLDKILECTVTRSGTIDHDTDDDDDGSNNNNNEAGNLNEKEQQFDGNGNDDDDDDSKNNGSIDDAVVNDDVVNPNDDDDDDGENNNIISQQQQQQQRHNIRSVGQHVISKNTRNSDDDKSAHHPLMTFVTTTIVVLVVLIGTLYLFRRCARKKMGPKTH